MRARLCRLAIAAAFALIALTCVPPAFSAQDPVIADCIANQQVTGNYTIQQLRHALNTLSPTTKEYTNCYDAINRAIEAKSGTGNGSSNASGGSFLPTPLLILLIVLVLAAAGYGALAWRRRDQSGGSGDEETAEWESGHGGTGPGESGDGESGDGESGDGESGDGEQ